MQVSKTVDLSTFSRWNFPDTLAQAFPFQYRALTLRVLDGDTAEFLLDLGVDSRHEIAVRFADVSAPEMGAPGGPEAKEFLESIIPVGTPVGIESQDLVYERYSFRRIVGRVYRQLEDGTLSPVSMELIRAGHAIFT